jgi:hypothetical protein
MVVNGTAQNTASSYMPLSSTHDQPKDTSIPSWERIEVVRGKRSQLLSEGESWLGVLDS